MSRGSGVSQGLNNLAASPAWYYRALHVLQLAACWRACRKMLQSAAWRSLGTPAIHKRRSWAAWQGSQRSAVTAHACSSVLPPRAVDVA